MAPEASKARLGLLVRSEPWHSRSGREALDLALAVVSLDLRLELVFMGGGAEQLVAGGKPAVAALAPGLKAWASVPELGPTRCWIQRQAWERLQRRGVDWILKPEPLDAAGLGRRLRRCDRLLVV
jgi:sulfur relay (sulfurtransferase) DsrF/TusC family protein